MEQAPVSASIAPPAGPSTPAPAALPDKTGAGETDAYLRSLGEEIQDAFARHRRVMSFGEFFALSRQHPTRYVRSAAQYLKDVFDHYGTTEVPSPHGPVVRYRLFDCPFANGKDRLIGQEEVQGRVYRVLGNFVREGRISKLILLHGPNGSAKSTFASCLMRAMEHYSTLEEGALYRFNWIFPTEALTRGGLGFGSRNGAPEVRDSFAYLDDDEVDVKLVDETCDHPLLLLPQQRRRELLTKVVLDHPEFVAPDYLTLGDLSPRNQQIFEALLLSYKGDFLKVLRHVQVERLYISRRYRRGVVTVEPQMAVDASARQITADRSLGALPPALQSLSLFSFSGELLDGNRGLIEYADLLKRPLEAYKYLLGTVEHGRVPVDGHILYLDELFISSSNELHLSAFKEVPEFQSFKGRMELMRVPYLLDFTKEQLIYDEQVGTSSVGKHVAPHATRVAALFGVLTRMRRPDSAYYEKRLGDKVLFELASRLTPLEKAYLYAMRRPPPGLTAEQSKELLSKVHLIFGESDSYPIYEGLTGISPRELKTLLLNAAQSPHHRCLSPFAVLEEIEELLKAETVHAFLRMEVQPGGYHDNKRFVAQVKDELLVLIDEEVRSAMGLVDESQYTGVFMRYVNHVSHWIKKEKVFNAITGDLEEPDEKMMAEIEKTLGVTMKREDHRKDLIRRIAAWFIDHPQEARGGPQRLDYTLIFPQHFQLLRESYFAERKKILKKTNQDLLLFLSEDDSALQRESLDPESVQRVQTTLKGLTTKYGYCNHCARDAIQFLLRRRYA